MKEYCKNEIYGNKVKELLEFLKNRVRNDGCQSIEK
jgi:hypothetical protein